MHRSFDIYTERALKRFNQIAPTSYREVISFYELNIDELKHLEIESYLDVQITYSSALFEVGRYQAFISLADQLIELVIFQNITLYQGEDIYQKLLFKKAAAYYQILEWEQSHHILMELLKIDPSNVAAEYLIKQCLIKLQPRYLRFAKGLSILLFFLSAMIIAFELLVVRPFFGDWISIVEIFRSSIFFIGILMLVASEVWHRISSFRNVNKIVKQISSSKRKH